MSSKAGQSFRMSDGDWVCDDQDCQNINFARRMNCNLCGKDRPVDQRLKDKDPDSKRKIGHEIGKAAADKSKGLFSADDWQCGRCGNVNWARRSTCNMCSAPKFGENEERTGLGGGYNERDERVEYVRRSDSEDEYDDFGRRKKKLKRSDNDSDHSRNRDRDEKKDSSSSDNSEESEDEEDGDVSKYKLESDQEEDEEGEDEEDDGDEDLSKYDLSDCLDDKK